jgi:hypothetical protein
MGISDFCHWDSGCRKKIRFSHAVHARVRIRHILRLGDGLAVGELATYRCQFCHGFHIGHARSDQHRQKEGRG